MSLRIQLFAVGLLALAIPWAGYRYVQELEGALRNGLEQSMLASTNTMAAALALELQPLASAATGSANPINDTIYAHPLNTAPDLDGDISDWGSIVDKVGIHLRVRCREGPTCVPIADAGQPLGGATVYWAGLLQRTVYLFISVTDEDLIYQSAPTETPYGDRIVLHTGDQYLLLHRSGPGGVRAQHSLPSLFAPTAQFEDRVSGYWRETATGYDVELRLPLDFIPERLGLKVIDVDHGTDGAAYDVSWENSWTTADEITPGAFVYHPQSLDSIGRQFVLAGMRMRIVDAQGWVIFDGGEIDPLSNSFASSSISLAEQFYRFILARGDAPYQELEDPPGRLADPTLSAVLEGESVSTWYARGTDASAVVVAATPIRAEGEVRGGVILEQGSDSILTLTNEALVRLMSFTLLASLLVAVGLLSYATLLSYRVRKLARAADTALSPEGKIHPTLPGVRASDEIGDLARSFTDLLNRLSHYTDYLTTLKAKLAHELRTPLAVVSTSLDNLEHEPHESHLSPYLLRLREGTDRLEAILGAMSEATLIEQAVADTKPEVFAVDAVVASCVTTYRDVYHDWQINLDARAPDSRVMGSADLIAQMLDKLIDNAVSFSEPGSTISVALSHTDKDITISVSNSGPLLPESMRNQLFDSLVSMREKSSERRHLGLGLYIVELIVKFHRGRVNAEDLADGSGVCFEIVLPRGR
jgi:two-component system sensor histidine kinase ChvG